jgi:hypothetical protein
LRREIFSNKNLFCGLVLLALPLLIQGEIFNYRESGGTVTVTHALTFTAVAGGYAVELNTTRPDEQVIRQTFRTAADFSTLAWTFSYPGRQMELDAKLQGEAIILSGTFCGKKVEKKFAAAGAPWNQLFQMGLGSFVLSKEKSFQFRSIGTQGPGEMKIGNFTVKRKNDEKIKLGGKDIVAVHVRISLSGLLSIFWHGDYWYRQSDGRFLRFFGVNKPGGPIVVCELVE